MVKMDNLPRPTNKQSVLLLQRRSACAKAFIPAFYVEAILNSESPIETRGMLQGRMRNASSLSADR